MYPFEDDVPFPQVGYVNFLEGITFPVFRSSRNPSKFSCEDFSRRCSCQPHLATVFLQTCSCTGTRPSGGNHWVLMRQEDEVWIDFYGERSNLFFFKKSRKPSLQKVGWTVILKNWWSYRWNDVPNDIVSWSIKRACAGGNSEVMNIGIGIDKMIQKRRFDWNTEYIVCTCIQYSFELTFGDTRFTFVPFRLKLIFRGRAGHAA